VPELPGFPETPGLDPVEDLVTEVLGAVLPLVPGFTPPALPPTEPPTTPVPEVPAGPAPVDAADGLGRGAGSPVPVDASGALPSTGGPGHAMALLALALIAGGLLARARAGQTLGS
jgi:hypothetical protein